MNRKYSLVLYDTRRPSGPGQEVGRLEGPVIPDAGQYIWFDGAVYHVSQVIPCYDTGTLGSTTKSPVGDGGRPDALVYGSCSIPNVVPAPDRSPGDPIAP